MGIEVAGDRDQRLSWPRSLVRNLLLGRRLRRRAVPDPALGGASSGLAIALPIPSYSMQGDGRICRPAPAGPSMPGSPSPPRRPVPEDRSRPPALPSRARRGASPRRGGRGAWGSGSSRSWCSPWSRSASSRSSTPGSTRWRPPRHPGCSARHAGGHRLRRQLGQAGFAVTSVVPRSALGLRPSLRSRVGDLRDGRRRAARLHRVRRRLFHPGPPAPEGHHPRPRVRPRRRSATVAAGLLIVSRRPISEEIFFRGLHLRRPAACASPSRPRR